jgi:hypothetical protein
MKVFGQTVSDLNSLFGQKGPTLNLHITYAAFIGTCKVDVYYINAHVIWSVLFKVLAIRGLKVTGRVTTLSMEVYTGVKVYLMTLTRV